MKRVRLKDIADPLNLSINTVSRALRGKPDVNESTRTAVLLEAKKIGYDIPQFAELKTNDEHLAKAVGVVLPDTSNPFFSEIIQGVQQVLSPQNIMTLLCDTHEQYSREVKSIDWLISSSNVSGIILCANQAESEDIQHLKDSGIPFVLIGRVFSGLDADYVISDDFQGAYDAVNHLIRLGHKNILFINTKEYVYSAEERYRGYCKAHEDNGLKVDKNTMRICEPTMESAYNSMKSIFLEGLDFSAVFAFSDIMVYGILRAIKERGRQVPNDISLVGFDNILFSSMLSPPLTTINQQKMKMGINAATILLEKLKGASETRKIILPTELIIRESTARFGV